MSDNNAFRALAKELSEAKDRERFHAHSLHVSRSKIHNAWQPAIAAILLEANRAFQGTEINFVVSPEYVRDGGDVAGLSYPINGITRASRLEIKVNNDPTFAELRIVGHQEIKKVGIATSTFPKDDFEEAIALLMRRAIPLLNVVETLID